ncbi:MAG TPA: DNA alkylation repair protein, partial [Myxococcota bacterium]|nr:DNA alkylation repair protein [Myxococcota bacterium]
DAPATRLALLRHALRDRVKKGDSRALALVGAEGGEQLQAEGRLSEHHLRIGDKVQVEVAVTNPSGEPVQAEVDLVVHFIKANGKSAPKVFKGAQLLLQPGQTQRFRRTVSFAVHSTRQPYPGSHRLEIQVNGRLLPLGTLELHA